MKHAYLREALELAAEGQGQASPNPLAGALLVKDEKVVGRGFHTYAGVKHAEIHALEQAGELLEHDRTPMSGKGFRRPHDG